MLDRDTATTYAGWFRALADPTRVQILNLLTTTGGPMTVGEVVDRVAVGQSTVSVTKILTDARFVLAEPRGTARLYRVNERCLTCFPPRGRRRDGTPRGSRSPTWHAGRRQHEHR